MMKHVRCIKGSFRGWVIFGLFTCLCCYYHDMHVITSLACLLSFTQYVYSVHRGYSVNSIYAFFSGKTFMMKGDTECRTA